MTRGGEGVGARLWLPEYELGRDELLARARELEVFPDPEDKTDKQLADAIAAERAAGDWLDRLEQLPTDEAKRDAVHRLRLSIEGEICTNRNHYGSVIAGRCTVCQLDYDGASVRPFGSRA